jgi:site-specific recombinase XerD
VELRIVRKGRSARESVYSDDSWLGTQLTEIATSLPAEDAVFGELDRFAAARSVKAVREQAGLRPPPHPHLLRHTFVSQLLAAGVPVREVQQLAGHASLATTQRYADAVNHSNRRVSKILRGRFARPQSPD